jgi:glycosyltransferase involved in cell wall biosynthesis
MRVLIQAEDYLPNIGGIASHVQSLAVGLISLGVGVTVLTTRKDIQRPRNLSVLRDRESVRDGVRAIEVPVVYSPRNILTGWQIRQRFTKRIERLVAARECDLVHYHFWDFDARVVAPLRGRVPIVFTNHSSQFLENFDNQETHSLLRERVGIADAIIAPSLELRDKTAALGFAAEACHYIPNSVDTGRFRPDSEQRAAVRRRLGIGPDAPVILCARRAVPKNGVINFCEALEYLENDGPEPVVLFAGLSARTTDPEPDPYKELLWRQLDLLVERKIGVRILCLGQVPQDEMLDYYQAADISVLPSLREATSITGLESMACGLSIVGSAVGGIPEIVTDRKEGLLVPPGDSRALASALNVLIRDGSLRHCLGASARDRAEQEFGIVAGARRVLEVYDEAMRVWHEKMAVGSEVRP